MTKFLPNFKLLLLVLSLWLLLLAACGETPTAPVATTAPNLPKATATPLVNRKIGYTTTNPVARVGSVDIGSDDFNKALDEARATAEEQAGGFLDWAQAENAELLKSLRLQTLEGLINFQVVAAEAKKENVVAQPAEIQARLEDVKKQMGNLENYQSWLARRFINEADLKARLAQTLVFEQMSEKHSTAEEKGEQVQVRHILVQTEQEARDLYKRLQQGADFTALAKQFSLDSTSAERGGDLGWVFRGQTDAAFESAAFALRPNQYSGPIKTEKGYHLIQLLAKEVRPLPFDLVQQRRAESFSNYIKSLRDKTKIEKFLNL